MLTVLLGMMKVGVLFTSEFSAFSVINDWMDCKDDVLCLYCGVTDRT